ncbi:MAG TPA: metallophosphoesterase family protein [Chloroflexota bacterium]|nr:metallophosphoesterase family protein [Chloroflexota bacterium]
MIIGVLADTHIPKRARDLPLQAYQHLEQADAIVHAGDVLTMELLERLERIAPVYAVLGNNDRGLALPERLELSWEGVELAVIHDSGSREGRQARLRRWFPAAQAVVFGHSHMPLNERHDGLLLFNPGSPTDRRRQPNHTMGLLRIRDGLIEGEIIHLD